MQVPLSVLIVGTGPGGLMLAALLQKKNIPYLILEADPSPSSRTQGGSLDIHASSGQLAIKEAGLLPRFESLMRLEGQAFRICDAADGRVCVESEAQGRPEIDRVELRRMLIDAVKPERIWWGARLEEVVVVEEGEDRGGYMLRLADGRELRGYGLVVGADGAWSKIRSLVTDARPSYSGISVLDIWTKDIQKRKPKLAEMVGKGTWMSLAENKVLSGQRGGDGSLRTYAFMRVDETWPDSCGIDWQNPNQAKKELADTAFPRFSKDAKALLLEADDDAILRRLYMLPVGLRWSNKPRITVLGDAAHLMTPFAGVGVNVALVDALELARELEACRKLGEASDQDSSPVCCEVEDLKLATARYEEKMFARAETNATRTFESMKRLFADDAHEQMLSLLHSSKIEG
ncbi:MAG: hypothetical protein Q9227_002409 [Pyrenula ochraceoflavens]